MNRSPYDPDVRSFQKTDFIPLSGFLSYGQRHKIARKSIFSDDQFNASLRLTTMYVYHGAALCGMAAGVYYLLT